MWISLLGTGVLIALLPLLLVWFTKKSDRYQKLAWVTLFLTFDLIVFGAFTRLTDSGLGCPDWPGCYSHANPWLAHDYIMAAQELMPTGPVTVMKAWIEMTHRYLAMAVGFLIIILLVEGWRRYRRGQAFFPWFQSVLLAWVCLQGAFGAWTVTLKLQPIIVTMHLLLGMGLLALLVCFVMRLKNTELVYVPLKWRYGLWFASALLWMQIALGGWVSTNYAALACGGFPLCNGQFFPVFDWEHGFSLWRALGETAGGEYFPFSGLVTINWVHRWMAFVVLLVLGGVAYKMRSIASLSRSANYVLMALSAQFLLGIMTVSLGWPLLVAVLHNAGAAVLVSVVTMLSCHISKVPCSVKSKVE
jgi:cytochrome c oxidase assembly protein subunit 15